MELKVAWGSTEALLTNNSFGVYRVDYVPKAPSTAGGDVTEPAEIFVTSFDSGVALNQRLNELFQKARDYHESNIGEPVYVKYRLDEGDAWWMSEVRDGRVEMPRRTLGAHRRGNVFAFQVTWTRQGFWDLSSLTSVQMTNGNGTNQVTLTLDNNTNHYATIAAGVIQGDLPTPAKISITNNGASPLGAIRIGHGHIPATSQGWIIQGESVGGGTVSATSSGGQYKALSVTTGETTLINLTLSGTLLNNAKRGYFRLMARFTGNPTGAVRMKAQLLYDGNVLHTGKWVRTTANQEWLDLGDVQLPPYESGGNSVALTLRLIGKADTATTVNLDYIVCLPLDSWRKFVPVGTGLVGGHKLVDDGPAGWVYEIVGTDHVSTHAAYGSPVMLYPNVAQKLIVLQVDDDGVAGIDLEIFFTISYRQRITTL